jgi:two-component system response regulator RegX3
VLIVDDETDIADTVEAVLRSEGFRVITASDGPQALDALRRERPDLVLLDYEMPGMTGTEVCGRIRRTKTERRVPVLLATAAMIDLSQLADADGFLVKPYQREVLLGFVTRLVQRGGAPAVRRQAKRRPLRSGDRPQVRAATRIAEEE